MLIHIFPSFWLFVISEIMDYKMKKLFISILAKPKERDPQHTLPAFRSVPGPIVPARSQSGLPAMGSPPTSSQSQRCSPRQEKDIEGGDS